MYGVVPEAGGVRRIGESHDGTAATQMERVKVVLSRDVAVQTVDSCDSTEETPPCGTDHLVGDRSRVPSLFMTPSSTLAVDRATQSENLEVTCSAQQTSAEVPKQFSDAENCTSLDDITVVRTSAHAAELWWSLLHEEHAARASIERDSYDSLFQLQGLVSMFLRQCSIHDLELRVARMQHETQLEERRRSYETSHQIQRLVQDCEAKQLELYTEWLLCAVEHASGFGELNAKAHRESHERHRLEYDRAIIDAEELRVKLAASVSGEARQRQRLVSLLKEPCGIHSSEPAGKMGQPVLCDVDLHLSVHERFARAHMQAAHCVAISSLK